MSDTELAPAKGPGAQLRPAGELRRPDLHGQLPHIFTTMSPNKPIGDLELEDIVEINWTGVTTAIQDALIRVRHEGDLTSTTVRDTIRLTALALKKLEVDDAQLVRTLNGHPGIGFIGWWFSFLPTETGTRLRNIRLERKQLGRKREALRGYREEIFSLRTRLANEVDARIGMQLMATNPDYAELEFRLSQLQPIRVTARQMLGELQERDALVRNGGGEVRINQIMARHPGFRRFCFRVRGDGCGLTMRSDHFDTEVCLMEIIAEYDAAAAPFEGPMIAMRETEKQKIYGESAAH